MDLQILQDKRHLQRQQTPAELTEKQVKDIVSTWQVVKDTGIILSQLYAVRPIGTTKLISKLQI